MEGRPGAAPVSPEPPEQCPGQSPTCIPRTGCAQGARPTRSHRHADPMEQLLGLLHLVFQGFFFVFFEFFDVII